jgi:hypothetical protein
MHLLIDILYKQQGRPDWSEFFRNTAVGASPFVGSDHDAPHRVSVLVCGPDSLMRSVSAATTAANSAAIKYHVHKESFE